MGNEKRKSKATTGSTPSRQPKALQQTKLWQGQEFRSSPSSSPLPELSTDTQQNNENQGVTSTPTADANAPGSNPQGSAFTPVAESAGHAAVRPAQVSNTKTDVTKKASNRKKQNGPSTQSQGTPQETNDEAEDAKPAARSSTEQGLQQGDGWFLSDAEEFSEPSHDDAGPSKRKPDIIKHAQKAARAAIAANQSTTKDRSKQRHISEEKEDKEKGNGINDANNLQVTSTEVFALPDVNETGNQKAPPPAYEVAIDDSSTSGTPSEMGNSETHHTSGETDTDGYLSGLGTPEKTKSARRRERNKRKQQRKQEKLQQQLKNKNLSEETTTTTTAKATGKKTTRTQKRRQPQKIQMHLHQTFTPSIPVRAPKRHRLHAMPNKGAEEIYKFKGATEAGEATYHANQTLHPNWEKATPNREGFRRHPLEHLGINSQRPIQPQRKALSRIL